MSTAPSPRPASFDALEPVSAADVEALLELIRDAFREHRPERLTEAASRADELSRAAGTHGLQQQSVLAHIVAHELRMVCSHREVTPENWTRIEETCRRLIALVGNEEPVPSTRRGHESGMRRKVDADAESDESIDAFLDRVLGAG